MIEYQGLCLILRYFHFVGLLALFCVVNEVGIGSQGQSHLHAELLLHKAAWQVHSLYATRQVSTSRHHY